MCFISTLGIFTTMIGQIKLQTILSQLKITKFNIIEKFWKGKQQNHYRKCKNTKKKGK